MNVIEITTSEMPEIPKAIAECPECGALYWADCICEDEDDYWYNEDDYEED